jgi:TRAP-type mannitol/chloroaromatic compound transport system permease large subunit
MELSVIVLIVSFVFLLLCNVPIAISIGVATVFTMLFTIAPGPAITTVAQQMATGINSFALLAIPFFILSGLLMASTVLPCWRFRSSFSPVCSWGAEASRGA